LDIFSHTDNILVRLTDVHPLTDFVHTVHPITLLKQGQTAATSQSRQAICFTGLLFSVTAARKMNLGQLLQHCMITANST